MTSLTSGGVVSAGRDGKLLAWNVSSGDAAPLVSLRATATSAASR